jgi:hypothetical protein
MDKQQVDVLGAQVAQRLLDLVVHPDRAELGVPELRREEDLVAVAPGVVQTPADLRLVAVGAGGVDVVIAELERVAHGDDAVAAGDLPRPEAELRNRDALHGEGGVGGRFAWHRAGMPRMAWVGNAGARNGRGRGRTASMTGGCGRGAPLAPGARAGAAGRFVHVAHA